MYYDLKIWGLDLLYQFLKDTGPNLSLSNTLMIKTVDLSHGANWTRIVTSYFSVDAYSHLFRNFATRVAKFFVFFLKKSDFLIKRIFKTQILGN